MEGYWEDHNIPEHLLASGRPVTFWLGGIEPQQRALDQTREFAEVNRAALEKVEASERDAAI
jgi:hypothetical protein